MVLYVGDDPASKSSTVPAVSERSLAALGIPVLFPRNASEIVTMGMHAVALSRASGCIVALKIVADVADGAWTVDGSVADVPITVPQIEWEGRPFVYQQRPMAAPTDSVIAEADLYGPRWAIVNAYNAANDLDVIELDPHRRDGRHRRHRHDFRRGPPGPARPRCRRRRPAPRRASGCCASACRTRSARERLLEFADGLDEILVVEDKTAFIETQVREILYGTPNAPRILGKKDAQGRRLMPVDGELTAGRLLAPLRRVLRERVELKRPLPAPLQLDVLSTKRAAYFCSGCPHNRSTAIPEGSIAGGGIGCHTMVTMSGRTDSAVTGLTQMGGEGAQWIGQAPVHRRRATCSRTSATAPSSTPASSPCRRASRPG